MRPNYYKNVLTLPMVDNPLAVAHVVLEPIDIIHQCDYDFDTGNALKYLMRAGKKPGNERLQDLNKCLTYVQMAIDQARRQEPKQPEVEVKAPVVDVTPSSDYLTPEAIPWIPKSTK